ncbi:35405_t:CDS:2, partial [Racocetra persica]
MIRSNFSIRTVSIFILLAALCSNVSSVPTKRSSSGFEILDSDRETGIAAMHIVVTASNKIIIIDKVQNNTFHLPDGRTASSVEYDLETGDKRSLPLVSNTFCSSGSFLKDNTLLSTGGAEQIK